MKPGPENIYQCPFCENLISRGSLRSGNTFGANLYSDGKQIAPMLPEFPSITKCSKCKNIFWIDKAKLVGTNDLMDFFEPVDAEFEEVDEIEFLNLEEYFTAIDKKLYSNDSEELFLRVRIWWAFNDRIRHGKELFRDEPDRSQWIMNVNRLQELLDYGDFSERIMIAELNRNLGRFDKCIEIINSIESPDLNWIKSEFKNECLKKNTEVFEISPS